MKIIQSERGMMTKDDVPGANKISPVVIVDLTAQFLAASDRWP